MGGKVPRGADVSGVASWRVLPVGAKYTEADGAADGITKIKVIPGTGNGQILVKGKGANLSVPALPATLPLVAQMTNLDNGVCWETPFAMSKVNQPGTVVVQQ